MIYCEFAPDNSLNNYVKCYWTLETYGAEISLIKKILPGTSINIIFQKKCFLSINLQNGQNHILPRFLVGPHCTKGRIVGISGRVCIMGIRLQPYAGKIVLERPVTELNQQIGSVADLLPAEYYMLGEQALASNNINEAIKEFNSFFQKKMNRFLPVNNIIRNFCDTFSDNSECERVKAFSCRNQLTPAAFRSIFMEHTGVCPKDYIKIKRFKKAIRIMCEEKKKRTKSLTGIGLTCGYFDQAHFIRDFKYFTGFSPGAYLKMNTSVYCADLDPYSISLFQTQRQIPVYQDLPHFPFKTSEGFIA